MRNELYESKQVKAQLKVVICFPTECRKTNEKHNRIGKSAVFQSINFKHQTLTNNR